MSEEEATTTTEETTTVEEPAVKEDAAAVEGEVAEEVAEEEVEEEEVEYSCPQEFEDKEEMKKMFVGGLDKDTTDEEFKGLFSTFGEIAEANIIKKEGSKSPRLFGFITFVKCDSLDDCLLARPHMYKDKELEVKRAVPKGRQDEVAHLKVKKLHIGNIPETFDTKPLKKFLLSRHPKKYGTIEDITFLKSKDKDGNVTEKNRGFGFITVSSEDLADRISIGESKFNVDGNDLTIAKAKPKPGEPGFPKGGFGGGRGGRGGFAGGPGGYGGFGGGYGGYGGYGGGYGGGYDYYGYPAYQSFGPQRGGGRGRGKRYNPY